MQYQRDRAEVRRRLKDVQRLAAQYEIGIDGQSSAQAQNESAVTGAPASLTNQSAPFEGTPGRFKSDADLLAALLVAVQVALVSVQRGESLSAAETLKVKQRLSQACDETLAGLAGRRP